MKKTLYINLNGFAFHIEEDAYDKLHQYLLKIEKSITDPEEAKEIISDIEARIAELFQGSHPSADEVITLSKVDEVIQTMGEPQDIIDDEDQTENTTQQSSTGFTSPSYRKRLYRDPDNRVFGGVCGGLAAYFNLDPLVFRVIFLLSFILYGVSLIAYIILWIIMPKAVTITQRLEMKGPASYEKWEQNLKEEYQDVSRKFKNSKAYQDLNSGFSKGSDKMGELLHKFIHFVGSVIGLLLMVVTMAALVSLVLVFTFGYTFFDFSDVSSYYASLPGYFLSSTEMTLGSIGIMLITGIPLLMLFYLGFKLVFKFKTRSGLLALIALGLWISGLVLVVYTSASVARNYSKVESQYKKEQLIEPESATIYLKPNTNAYIPDYQKHLFDINHLNVFVNDGFDKNHLDVYVADDQIYVQGNPTIELVRGADFSVDIKKTARGRDIDSALESCNSIEYFWIQKDSVLYIDPIFTLAEGAKIRDQRIKVVFTIPEGFAVDVDDELRWVVNDGLD